MGILLSISSRYLISVFLEFMFNYYSIINGVTCGVYHVGVVMICIMNQRKHWQM